MIETIENAIIERLKSDPDFKGMDIEPFPANFEEYNFTSEFGCILVRYAGETLSDPQTLTITTQTNNYTFKIALGLRYLTLLKEAHPFITKIKQLLTGYVINGKRLFVSDINYAGKVNKSDNFWEITVKIILPYASQKDNIVPIWFEQAEVSGGNQ